MTNSITQGEQVPALWPHLHQRGLHITFGWRTFDWTSEARGRAHVHVVIIGFQHSEAASRARLYEPSPDDGLALSREVPSLNGYLVAGSELYPRSRSTPIVPVPPVSYGSKPADGGHLVLTSGEAREIEKTDPVAAKYIRPLLSCTEFLNGDDRYCLWLVDADPVDIGRSPELRQRLAGVRRFRESSKKTQTYLAAETPGLFAEIREPRSDFVFVPIHVSSERRLIPMGFVRKEANAVVHNSGAFIEDADLALFGLLQSEMFTAWQRVVGGRIKSDFRFNNRLVFNTFPFPDLTDKQRDHIESEAAAVIAARADHRASLSDLYRTDGTPANLVSAHRRLDQAVDSAFGRRSAPSESERLAILFARYEDALQHESPRLQVTMGAS